VRISECEWAAPQGKSEKSPTWIGIDERYQHVCRKMKVLDPLRDALRKTPVHRVLRSFFPSEFVPPPGYEFKRRVIIDHGRRFGAPFLVETGTYLGETMEACLPHFDQLHSIELSESLHREAAQRLRGESRVTLHLGHSPDCLDAILPLPGRTLFWLDAHFSGSIEKNGRMVETARGSTDTPIVDELRVIFERCDGSEVILIDDAREFDGTGDYPSLDQIEELVRTHRPAATIEVLDDVIRIYGDGDPAGRRRTAHANEGGV
jgi:hypothetical protein